MNQKKIFLFDLDGVLIDSKKNMQLSWHEIIKKYKLKIPFKKYFSYIGVPFLKILEKLKINKNFHKTLEKEYKKNSIKNINSIKLHKDVKKTFNYLKINKKIIGILTSKEKSRTLKILKKHKIKVDVVLCPIKNLIGKPNPRQINDLSKKTKTPKNKIVYIGDMYVDKQTAKNAKIDYIHANYGYFKKIKSKYSINRISDIITNNLGIN
tara:strand:+ start:3533 stop:4159 length:627 start_codon:yes stop_codon:yes gene_type:complete